MRERPILFSGPMVRAILEGRKTVTRRVCRDQPHVTATESFGVAWPDGKGTDTITGGGAPGCYLDRAPYQVGDRLWVREAHTIFPTHGRHREDGMRWGPWAGLPTVLSADGTQVAYFREGFDRCDPGRWRPSIHMPRWASRITLEVTAVRVERLQDISEGQAMAEGIDGEALFRAQGYAPLAFERLWESINGSGSWAENPWVWVVEFKRVEQEVPGHG